MAVGEEKIARLRGDLNRVRLEFVTVPAWASAPPIPPTRFLLPRRERRSPAIDQTRSAGNSPPRCDTHRTPPYPGSRRRPGRRRSSAQGILAGTQTGRDLAPPSENRASNRSVRGRVPAARPDRAVRWASRAVPSRNRSHHCDQEAQRDGPITYAISSAMPRSTPPATNRPTCLAPAVEWSTASPDPSSRRRKAALYFPKSCRMPARAAALRAAAAFGRQSSHSHEMVRQRLPIEPVFVIGRMRKEHSGTPFPQLLRRMRDGVNACE
jgi:hypothetical protein